MRRHSTFEDDEDDESTCDEEDDEDYEDEESVKYEDGDITEDGKPYLKLLGTDGNVFSILGKALRAGKKAKWSEEKINEYKSKMTSGNYDNALCVTMEYFDVN